MKNIFIFHGMIVQGEYKGDHYGPVAIGKPNEKVKERCLILGKSVTELAKKLSASSVGY